MIIEKRVYTRERRPKTEAFHVERIVWGFGGIGEKKVRRDGL